MLEFIQSLPAQLRAIDPALPAALLTTFVFVAIYLLRRFFPKVWAFVESTVPFVDSIDPGPGLDALWKSWQAWPAMALGAVTSALINGVSVRHALWGVFCGALSAVAHTLMSLYQGKVGGPKQLPKPERMFPSDPPPPSFPSAAALLLLCCISLHSTACSVFGKGGPVWPIVAKCEPSPVELVDAVTAVLLAGGDYEAALEALAEKYGAAAIVCVVDGLIGEFNPADSKQAAAIARGKAFLAQTGTKVER